MHHLETNNQLDNRQFGFRPGKSCERALQSLEDYLDEAEEKKKIAALVSMDIKGAFDSIRWSDVMQALEQTSCPTYLQKMIRSFLHQRSVSVDWGTGSHTIDVTKGCPQGSCLGPTLWLLVAETYLRRHGNSEVHRVIVFADDFLFLFQGEHRRDLERKAQPVITEFNDWTTEKGLELSATKTNLMTIHPKKKQLKREPTIKLNNKGIKAVKQMTYLGLVLSRNRTWLAHLRKTGQKIRDIAINLNKVSTRQWGISPKQIRIWYRTVVQRQIAYASHIWARKITGEMEKILDHIQRPFLIKMTRAYRTASTSALQVLSGSIPLHIYAEGERLKIILLRLNRPSNHQTIKYQPEEILTKRTSHHLPPHKKDFSKFISIKNAPGPTPINIYTDGSKHDDTVGAAYVVYKEGREIEKWQGKLQTTNSVFQAELLAITKALEYVTITNNKATIFTDSLSSLVALLFHDQRHPQVQDLQTKLARIPPNTINLVWVKAHAGTLGNERADELAKEAATIGEENPIPLPTSYIIRQIKEHCMAEWQHHWDSSENGRQVHEIFGKPRLDQLLPTASITAILTGHGPFIGYLHRFTKKQTSKCVCGREGTSIHYLLQCPLTSKWHLRPPPPGKEEAWGNHLLQSLSLKRRMAQLVAWLNENQDFLTSPE